MSIKYPKKILTLIEYFKKLLYDDRRITIDNNLSSIIKKKSIVVFTACTENYLDRAISLYNSLIEYNDCLFFIWNWFQ